MIAQVKIDQKTAQKVAIKRLINRSVIMTVIELLLIILILLSCQKEEEQMKKTKTVAIYGDITTTTGNWVDSAVVNVLLKEEPKRLFIKSAYVGVTDFTNDLNSNFKLYGSIFNSTSSTAGLGDFIIGGTSGNIPLSENQVVFVNPVSVNAGGNLGVKFLVHYSSACNEDTHIAVCCVIEFEYEE